VTIETLAASQDSVASRAQLTAVGVPWTRVRTELAARRWQVNGGAVVMHNGPLTEGQVLWCAVLGQPQPAALAGASAAIAGGLRTFRRDVVDVVIARHAHGRRRVGIRLHYADDVPVLTSASSPPRVRMPLAIVQACIWEKHERTASGLFIAAFQQRLVTTAAVLPHLQRLRCQPHASLLLTYLPEVKEGAGSLAEVEFTRLAAAAGLPKPIRQSLRPGQGGRRSYVDVDYGTFAVEIDGPLHWAGNVEAELARQNAIIRTGRPLLRFSTLTLRNDPEAVAAELRAAARDFGVPKAG
jgi:hypothetical protein